MLSLLFLPLMFIVGNFMLHIPYPEVPHSYLGQLDDPAYDAAGVTIAFTPITPTTRQIMNAVALKSVMTGITLSFKYLALSLFNLLCFVLLIFKYLWSVERIHPKSPILTNISSQIFFKTNSGNFNY